MLIFYTVDTDRHAFQALISIISVRKYSEELQDVPIIISFVEKRKPNFERIYKKYGDIKITVSKRFYPIHGWSNKLISSENISQMTKEHCLSLDCDMAVVGNIKPYLTDNHFNSHMAAKYSMPKTYLQKFFNRFKIKWPANEDYLMGNGSMGIFYPAIGVVYASAEILHSVFSNAVYYAKTILSEKLNDGIKYVGQSSVTLAINKINVPVNPLSDEMAFHMQSNVVQPNLDKNCKPLIIHHNSEESLLEHQRCKTMPNVKEQAEKVVKCILEAKKIIK
jgi:hypothetical protein